MLAPENDPPSNPLKGDLTIIELTIKNAKKLYNSPVEDEDANLDKYCLLKDNAGGQNTSIDAGGANNLKDFSSGVYPSSIVLWTGTLKKGDAAKGYSLSMDAIEITTPAEPSAFFAGKLQVGKGKGILAWSSDVIDLTADQKYALYFTLTDPEGTSRQFKIDPRLKGDTSSTTNYLHRLRACLEIPRGISIDDPTLRQKMTELREYVESLIKES